MPIYFDSWGIDTWPVWVLILFAALIISWRKQRSLPHLFFSAIFGIYLLYALDKVFFPIQVSGAFADEMRKLPVLSFVNLIPFYFGPYGSLRSASTTMIQNIILTIPFGFGLNFVTRVRAKQYLWLAPAMGLGIEVIQLIISLLLRFPWRVVDINDVLMNALGIWIGYGLFRIFARLYLWAAQHVNVERWGLLVYVHDIAGGANG